MEAVWYEEYDYHTDKCYQRPGCPECWEGAPVLKRDDGKYYCVNCHKEVAVTDEKMLKWLAEREETKVEIGDCEKIEFTDKLTGTKHTMGCGGKNCYETHYVRNKVTKEWQTAWGECKICGQRFIV